jgi:hypothetical protein
MFDEEQSSGRKGRIGCFKFFKNDGLHGKIVGSGEIIQIFLCRGARLHTHTCASELFGTLESGLGGDHEPLSVIEGDYGLIEPQRSIPCERKSCVSGQNIDFTRLQSRESLWG